MASKWLSITFFYKSIPIYPGKSRTIPESQLGRTMFLLTFFCSCKEPERDLNSWGRVRLQAKGGRKNAGRQQPMSAVEQALRSNVADNLVGITVSNGALKRGLFCYTNQDLQQVRMFVF